MEPSIDATIRKLFEHEVAVYRFKASGSRLHSSRNGHLDEKCCIEERLRSRNTPMQDGKGSTRRSLGRTPYNVIMDLKLDVLVTWTGFFWKSSRF